jgi:HK97 gp10 family phage protein
MTITGFDSLIEDMRKLDDFDGLAEEMIKESMPILTKEVKRLAKSHHITGEMLASIKPMKKPARTKHGWFMAVRPTGKDKNGVRNAEKMFILEYGSSQQEATPIIATAIANTEEEVVKKMYEVMERKLGK